jgi:hypothetical protein
MLFIRRMLLLVLAVAGGALASQAPELAQQYRQRLGGSIDELTAIIQDFDAHANHSGLDRQEALNVYAGSQQSFLRSQGEAMRHTFDRYEHLSRQLEKLNVASPILRPLVMLQHVDLTTFSNARRDFVPAVPLSIAGAVWAAVGVLTGAMLGLIATALLDAAILVMRRPFRRAETAPAGASTLRS